MKKRFRNSPEEDEVKTSPEKVPFSGTFLKFENLNNLFFCVCFLLFFPVNRGSVWLQDMS
jgi:hypothetical protein